MRDLLATLARALVERPERVRVSEDSEDGVTLLTLKVAPEDRGRVIGRQGRTADALRTLLAAVAHRHGTRCEMEIED